MCIDRAVAKIENKTNMEPIATNVDQSQLSGVQETTPTTHSQKVQHRKI